jgi:FKBP-type peptidyl-prolyl cis-trans isomerase
MKRIFTGLILIFTVVAFSSCKENDMEKQRQNELKKLDEFIRTHYADVERRPSGLYYIELEEGNGDSIQIGDRVQLFYEVYTLDSAYVTGTGRYEPVEVIVQPPTQLSSSAQLAQNTLGLHEALTYMAEKGKSRLIMPSELAFGQYGSYGLPGFTSVIMEVEVYKVYPAEVPEE